MMDKAVDELIRVLRRDGIHDDRALDALRATPRERFVPESLEREAYRNVALGIGSGQTISQPYIVALMTQELLLQPHHRVLEIGTGSGYQTAILARLCETVFTVERIEELSLRAQETLGSLGVRNVRYRIGDGSQGWPEEAPFDRIMVTATAEEVPKTLMEQLRDGSILVMPVGTNVHQCLYAYRRTQGELARTYLCSCRFVPLIGREAWPEDPPFGED